MTDIKAIRMLRVIKWVLGLMQSFDNRFHEVAKTLHDKEMDLEAKLNLSNEIDQVLQQAQRQAMVSRVLGGK